MESEFKSCEQITKYIFDNHGIKVYCHLVQGGYSNRYLKIIYLKNGEFKSKKYDCRTLYCAKSSEVDETVELIIKDLYDESTN